VKFPAYPRYKPSGVEWLGDVPDHWEMDRLKRVSTRVTDGAHISPDISSPDFPFVSTVDISGGRIDFNGCLRTTEDCYDYLVHTGCQPHKDDLLFSKDGTVGRTAVVDTEGEFVVASSLVIISPQLTKLKSKFLDYWLNNTFLQQHILLQMSGAALRRISVEKVSRLLVLLPPAAEQAAIAAFLDVETGRMDRLVEKRRELVERLKEKRTALISRTVTRGLPPDAARAVRLPVNPTLKPSGLDWLGDVPAHWKTSRIGFLATKIGSGKTPRGGAQSYQPEGVMLIRSQNVYDDGLRLGDVVFIDEETDEDMAGTRVQPQDVLLNITGASLGRCSVVPAGFPQANVNQHVCIVRPNPAKLIPKFAQFALTAQLTKGQIFADEVGSSREGLNFQQVRDLLIAVPPVVEQVAVATYLETETAKIDALVTKVEEAVERLQEYRIALITAAVTGRIDVRKVCT
jgi:type I restriction enzyme, S subunit